MICPQCSSDDLKVIDSRTGKDGFSIRRRRECNQCGARFTTSEEVIREGLSVLKRDGTVEDFDQQKLLNSIKAVLVKRPIEAEKVHLMLRAIIRKLENEFEGEIPTNAISENVMSGLKTIDSPAYVRYSSQYKPFVEG